MSGHDGLAVAVDADNIDTRCNSLLEHVAAGRAAHDKGSSGGVDSHRVAVTCAVDLHQFVVNTDAAAVPLRVVVAAGPGLAAGPGVLSAVAVRPVVLSAAAALPLPPSPGMRGCSPP